jgi:hypothetical protein
MSGPDDLEKRTHPDILPPGAPKPEPVQKPSEAARSLLDSMTKDQRTDFLRSLDRTENPSAVAKRFGISEEEVREAWKPTKGS